MERFAGRYVLLRRLGRGGMGAVYLALDLSTGTECALKRLDPGMMRADPDSLRREFELLTRLRHPSVVAVHEMGFAPDGTPFYTMEYVPGAPIDRAIRPGDWAAIAFAAAEVTHGLEALHGVGVVHGDLKPSNLLVLPGPEPSALPAGVRLLDFGLAALLGRDREGHRGTPGYVAPEVVRGEPPGVAADLYGLGATLFAVASGQAAFPRDESLPLADEARGGAPSSRPLEEAGVPGPLARLILRLMAPAPAERPSDAREVRRELERLHPAARRTLSARLRTETLVGRERELARLERWLAQGGEGASVFIVSGEAGVGRAALLRELAVRATLGGRPVIAHSCAAFEAPGALAAAVLRRLAVEGEAEGDASDLSRRALELLESGAPAFAPGDLSLLADAAAAWGRSARRRGAHALVLLDDCEKLDGVSRTLLRRMALHPRAEVRWVWAMPGGRAGLEEDDRILIDAGRAEHLALGPLDRESADRLVAARLHQPVPPALAEALWKHSGGHPGLLVELLRGAADQGVLTEGEGGVAVDPVALERMAFPADFAASLLARLAALSPAAVSAARRLAAWERPARREELDAALAALEELGTAGLAAPDEAGRWSLSPPGLAPQILASLPAEERRRLHEWVLAHAALPAAERFAHLRGAGRVEEALAAAAGACDDERLVTDAADLALAAAPAEAAAWQERAGRVLLERGRHRAAIPFLERALERQAESQARAGLWQLLSAAHLRAGRPAEVARVVSRGLAENPSERVRSLLLCNDATRLVGMGELSAAEAAAEEALTFAHSAADDEAAGMAALTLGGVHLALARAPEAERLARQAEEACSRAGHRLGRVRALGLRAGAVALARDASAADQLYLDATGEARAHDLRLAIGELLINRGNLLLGIGRWAEAREALAEALRVALEDGRSRHVAVALTHLALLDGLTGRGARALRSARAAVRSTRAYQPRLGSVAWRTLAQIYRSAGHWRAADRAARRGLALARKLGLAEELGWCQMEYAQLYAAAGRWKEAGEVCDRALEAPRLAGTVAGVLLAAMSGRAAARRGDFKAAAGRQDTCRSWLAEQLSPLAQAHVQQLEAECALAQGRVDRGLELAVQSLATFAGLPDPPDRAAAALEFGRLAMAAGADSLTPAGEWLQEAAAAFERLGDRRGRERALGAEVDWLRRSRASAARPAQGRDLLRSVSRLLDSFSDPTELTQRAMQLAVEQFGAERGVLLLADSQTGNLLPVVEHGAVDADTRDRALGFSRRVVERVARSGGSLLIGDAPSDPEARSDSVVGLGLRSIVCVPLYASGNVIGAVYLDDSRRSDVFSEADRGLLEGFAHLVAVAIEKSRGHEEVQRANELLVGENLSLRREAEVRFQPQNFIGRSSAMQKVLALVERAAQTSTTVLLTGENGTGKELIARTLHHSGRRHLGPFVAVNCGAIPETLLESELFGILPNVATGVRGREGRFVQAHGGTLFLDEIGDMPLSQQVALLSAIANREITPVGGGRAVPVDVRIIAATNCDLTQRIEEGAFREDLYYRLNVIPIEVPPLRERKADIPALAQYFTAHFAQQQEREAPELSPEFLAALMQSDWPGNVRELQNYIERVMAMTPGRVLQPRPLPRDLEGRPPRLRVGRGRRLADVIADVERQMVRETLERCGGNQSRAARELGMTEQSLRYRLRRYKGRQARSSPRPRKDRR